MNKDSRRKIDLIMTDIERSVALRDRIRELVDEYKDVYRDAATMIEELRDDEQEKLGNLSEGLQYSDLSQNLKAAVSALDAALDATNNIAELHVDFDDSDEIIQSLNEAKGY